MMKETPERYINPFLSDEENKQVNLLNQEVGPLNTEDDLNNSREDDKLISSLAPSEFGEKETELYTDKNVLECELPESLLCYIEGTSHVKDICVDEGLPHGERIMLDENNNETLKGYIDADLPVNEPINDNGNMGSKRIDAQIPVQDLQKSVPAYKERGSKEEVIDSVVPNEPEETYSSQSDTNSKAIVDSSPDISLQPCEEQINSSGISSLKQDRPLPSLKSLFESIHQQPWQRPEEELSKRPVENKAAMEDDMTLNLNNTETATSSGVNNVKNLERVNELSIEPPVHHGGEGESSFSAAGPISGLITYSGPIAFSGSTSLRSESSTTSTRSFAFPILQNEWNSSPVRMAKGDRRRLPKHRGWRHGLLCCKF